MSKSPDVPSDAAREVRVPRSIRADAVRNRARVLEAARAAFGVSGSDVSLDDIARSAGVGAGTVYRHFPTKQALFEAVVDDRVKQLIEQGRALGDAVDAGEALFSFFSLLVRESALKRDLMDTLAPTGAMSALAESAPVRNLFVVLAELLVRAQRAKAVRTDVDIHDLVAILTGSALAISRSSANEERTQRVLVIMCDGLRTRVDESND